MTATGFTGTIRPVDASIDGADRLLFEGFHDVLSAAGRHDLGDQDVSFTLEELRGFRTDSSYDVTDFIALEGNRVVGALALQAPTRDNFQLLDISLAVHPDHRRRGIGSALLAVAEQTAARAGRSILVGRATTAVGCRTPLPASPRGTATVVPNA